MQINIIVYGWNLLLSTTFSYQGNKLFITILKNSFQFLFTKICQFILLYFHHFRFFLSSKGKKFTVFIFVLPALQWFPRLADNIWACFCLYVQRPCLRLGPGPKLFWEWILGMVLERSYLSGFVPAGVWDFRPPEHNNVWGFEIIVLQKPRTNQTCSGFSSSKS